MTSQVELGFDAERAEREREELARDAMRLGGNIDRLFAAIADRGLCRGCGATVFWVQHKNGKRAPYDRDAVNHFITCPKRDEFKGGKHAETPRSDRASD